MVIRKETRVKSLLLRQKTNDLSFSNRAKNRGRKDSVSLRTTDMEVLYKTQVGEEW